MSIRMFALLAALVLAVPATAQVVTQVRAIEITTSNIKVPTTPNGRLTYRNCASRDCDAEYESARLTPATLFQVNDEVTDFAGFRQAFFNLPRGKDHYALVSVDLNASTVTSVQIAD